MNVVVNVNNYTPQKDDIIVYNGKEWTLVKKEVFLNNIISQVVKNEGEIKNLQRKNKELHDDIQKIAKVLKGEIGK